MSLPEQYLVTTKNLEDFLNAIINAQPPKKFTQKFLEALEFKSTNDRLLIGVLKALDFIDSEGVPQQRYYEFIDQTQSKRVLAESIEDAYSDLFAVNIKAYELSVNQVKNKFKTLSQGSKSDKTLERMANTFCALCNYADFQDTLEKNEALTISEEEREQPRFDNSERNNFTDTNKNEINRKMIELREITTEMHYNIQIHLPETRDIAVYDAIFRSLKEHLL